MNGQRMNAVMIGEDDITAMHDAWEEVPAWLKIHLAPKRPAHRYEGQLVIDDNRLAFYGRDMKEGKSFDIEVPLAAITDVGLGFDNPTLSGVDPVFGNGAPIPFAVYYDDGDCSRIAYFSILADNYTPHITADNIRCYEMLGESLERSAASNRRRELALTV